MSQTSSKQRESTPCIALENRPPFRYKRLPNLKSIRLLELFPGSPGSLVSCSILSVRLPSNKLRSPLYVACSYVWGSEDEKVTIELNKGLFRVRRNLYSFLQGLREANSHDGLLLWIDALCIDQSSLEERSSQVAFMGQIFQNAKFVISWIGKSQPELENIFHDGTAPLHLDFLEFMHEGKILPPSSRWRELFNSPKHSHRFRAVQHLAQNKYWRRIWIAQEVAIAVADYHLIIQCGNWTIRGQVVKNYLERIFPLISAVPLLPAVLSDIKEVVADINCMVADVKHVLLLLNRSLDGNFQTTFEHFGSLECSDRRDKVFALYNLVALEERTRMLPHVNYAMSTETLALKVLEKMPTVSTQFILKLFQELNIDPNAMLTDLIKESSLGKLLTWVKNE